MLKLDAGLRLSRSSRDFLGVVWPAIAEVCGGGEIVQTEALGVVVPPALEWLDLYAGIDYIQKTPHGIPYGIAARVQWARAPFDTFTVRRVSAGGRRTELQKRLAGLDNIHHLPLWPRWTVQAYLTDEVPGRLLSVGVVQTLQLYAHIRTSRERDGWFTQTAESDGAELVYVRWDRIPSYWAPIIIRGRP